MQTVFVKYEILDEKRWRDWCEQIMERADEAIETLIEEGVTFEACWELDGHVYGVMVADDLEAAWEHSKQSTRPIDEEHRREREACLKRVSAGEQLYALQGHP